MCGIAGFVGAWGNPEQRRAVAAQMGAELLHRGPDDGGTWVDECVALAHRRLSIVDLSPLGHQPMLSADERYVLVFNGEIYNDGDLRAELQQAGYVFRSRSDTEVILAACAVWGVGRAIGRMVGMFAFALWDRRDRHLVLARDRMGKKPLYWAQFNGVLLFGSELKALRAHPLFQCQLNRAAAASFIRHNYIPAPASIYAGVSKLPPAHILHVPWGGEPSLECYWDLRAIAVESEERALRLGDEEVVDRLETLLRDAVRRRMVADVSVGAFLSGGVDSSAVVALMQAESTRKVRTFSIGFDVADYDESHHARRVAEHLGTDHTELRVTEQHALDVIPQLPRMFDEPFADSSQIPTYLVSAMARRHVTVALSGDGGDELFAGYNRYLWAARLWGWIDIIPRQLRCAAAGAIRSVPATTWTKAFSLMPPRMRPPQAGNKLHRLAALLDHRSPDGIYRDLVSHWQPAEVMPDVVEPRDSILWDDSLLAEMPAFVSRMQLQDQMTYLPDDILVKVDRASMAVALEARAPLLDHRVVEFAWSLPHAMRVRGGEGKWALRQVLYRHVPRALVDRPKMGFGIPIGTWLRGPLREWAEHLLASEVLAMDGLFDPAPIRARWEEHLSGRRDWQYHLWDILMFQAWRQHWLVERPSAPSQNLVFSSGPT